MRESAVLKAVLFDWDGTLVNSAEASYRCFVRLFAAYGIPFDRATFERTYSPDWYRTYEAVGLPQERWSEANARWVQHYAEEAAGLVPGALYALERLRAAGLAQGLVTSGDRRRVERELAAHDVHGFFQVVVCSEDAPRRKPHPDALHLALDRLGVVPAGAAYVGDSPEDVEMARTAGVFSIGIPGGFPNVPALRAAAPDLFASTLQDAIGALLAR
jgi:HAD superfamily hydrolase (TIGR01509 family)